LHATSNYGEPQDCDATVTPKVDLLAGQLASRLELTFRTLGRRIYGPGARRASGVRPGLENSGVALLATLEAEDGLRPSDIAATLELDQSTVSRQLRQLADLGMISRRSDDDDGRASRIGLTEEGRAGLAAVRAARVAMLKEVFSSWEVQDQQTLLTLLDRLFDSLAGPSSATLGRVSGVGAR